LAATLIFNKLTGLPKKINDQRKAEAAKEAQLNDKLQDFDDRLTKVEEAVGHYPEYRNQSLEMQNQLQCADNAIVELCTEIKNDVIANGEMLNARLASLERREKNSLRAKILAEYRLYTDEIKNPMQAWSEMEHHSFFKLVEDYESLGGNDYVHGTILPAMNELDIIPMDDLKALKNLYSSRNVK
jgi:hypothetical protein